ncbi:hypothetical protein L873DRAFT_879987 [Choiromyces venosus 120613-1]|uniref:DDE-1 domain-containing protein n=1 Tax=Choiromyces venosus 120613-1 TaxID=1336337 RepID=A0A3N4JNB8_9PEZI|nr:hypothetical protein L873DRAFT_879987 [Choiromyces venosus 120613-1]
MRYLTGCNLIDEIPNSAPTRTKSVIMTALLLLVDISWVIFVIWIRHLFHRNLLKEKLTTAKSSQFSGWDKRQGTIQFTVFADGIPRVKPLIFFRGKGLRASILAELKEYDQRVIVKFNPTAYANIQNMVEWLDEQLVPALEDRPTLLALDLFGGHKMDKVLDTMKANDITPSVIPGGCTGLVQPLDVSINRTFKDTLKESLEMKLDKIEREEEEIIEAGGRLPGSKIGRRRVAVTWRVGEAWERFSAEKAEVVKKAFHVVGLALPIDGLADHEISIKGIDTEL